MVFVLRGRLTRVLIWSWWKVCITHGSPGIENLLVKEDKVRLNKTVSILNIKLTLSFRFLKNSPQPPIMPQRMILCPLILQSKSSLNYKNLIEGCPHGLEALRPWFPPLRPRLPPLLLRWPGDQARTEAAAGSLLRDDGTGHGHEDFGDVNGDDGDYHRLGGQALIRSNPKIFLPLPQ